MARFQLIPRPLLLSLLVIAAAAAITGCGFGAGPGTKDASVLVTTDFGNRRVGGELERQVPGSETVLSLLERHFRVGTRYGGGFVESIAGHGGTSSRRDWFFYVNGLEATKGAAATDVHQGDHIWWDLHDWSATENVPAVVGSYPEPFTNGISGKEFPTVLNCANRMLSACEIVGASLVRAGVKAADQEIGTGSGSSSLAVVVGTWSQIRGIIAAELIAGGPTDSGVYAQFVGAAGKALELDDPRGGVVSTLHGSAGLIAATGNPTIGEPTWFVTGTDAAGVMAAARAFKADKLDGHFAVAVTGTRVIPLPVDPGS